GGDRLAGLLVEHLQEAAHVRALLVVREGDVHVDGGDGVLVAAALAAQLHRVGDVLDAHAVDGDLARVLGGLHVGHDAGAHGGVVGELPHSCSYSYSHPYCRAVAAGVGAWVVFRGDRCGGGLGHGVS